MNYVGAYFFSKDVLPFYKELWKLLRLPRDVDLSDSALYLVQNRESEDVAAGSHNLGLLADCSGLLKNQEFLLSVFLLPKTNLEIL